MDKNFKKQINEDFLRQDERITYGNILKLIPIGHRIKIVLDKRSWSLRNFGKRKIKNYLKEFVEQGLVFFDEKINEYAYFFYGKCDFEWKNVLRKENKFYIKSDLWKILMESEYLNVTDKESHDGDLFYRNFYEIKKELKVA